MKTEFLNGQVSPARLSGEGMVKIVHLRKRQQPPASRKIILIDCLPGKGSRVSRNKRGLVVWATPASYPELIIEMIQYAEQISTPVIYVRGAPI